MEDSQVPSPTRNLDHAVNYIPLDLVFDILSRLPAKPLLRFQTVSKLWFSLIRSKDFVDTFLTRSKTRPRLLLTFKHLDSPFIFSAPEHEDDITPSKVMARHDMTISDLVYYIGSRPLNGLVCCICGSSSIAICNPTTRQIVTLPDVITSNKRDVYARLGYDPVGDQYKVLCVMMFDGYDSEDIQQEHFVFTLGSRHDKWRKIETVTKEPYRCMKGEVCVGGVVYYAVGYTRIARFDVRSEKVEFIQGPDDCNCNAVSCYTRLITYQGKLACLSYGFYDSSEIRMWILQDEEKQEWSSVVTCDVKSERRDLFTEERVLCTGEIHSNEAILVSRSLKSSEMFCVYYCDMVSERVRRGEVDGVADDEFRLVHGIGKHDPEMLCFPGHVENIMFF